MNVSGLAIKGHSYVWIAKDEDEAVDEVPVYAPADSRLLSVGSFPVPDATAPGGVRDDYELEFEVSCEVVYKYGHVSRLAPRLQAVAPSVPGYSPAGPLPVTAGEVVAYTRGTAQAYNWDFLLKSSSKQNQFTVQGRYERDQRHLVVADCPYDYYPEEMRAEYYALLDGGINPVVQGPSCLIEPEKPGTISGGWFTEPFNAADPFGVSQWAMTIGPWGKVIRITGLDNYHWSYPEFATYVDPKTTSEHCYEETYGPPSYVYLKLLSDTELGVVFADGLCPEQLPDGYQTYYR